MPKFKEIRAKLEAAQKISADLNQIAELDQSLVAQTQSNLTKAKESTVLQKLAELPIENMRDATDSTLRIETLRKHGLTSVGAIYLASELQLERISGITNESAIELKTIAAQMFDAVSNSVAYGINVDNLTAADLNLIENLQGLDLVRSKFRGQHEKVKPIAASLKESIALTKPLKSRLRWLITNSEKKQRALGAIERIAYLMSEPTTAILAGYAQGALQAYENSRPDPADARAVIEILGKADIGRTCPFLQLMCLLP